MARKYEMTNRSKQTAETTATIIAATEVLLARQPIDQVSLNVIAKEAGTTVQTVLRHMGSREGCLQAVVEGVSARVKKQRSQSPTGNIKAAISDLIDHYEAEGRLILNFLAQERPDNAFVAELMQQGRDYHRDWVARCFGANVPKTDQATIDALVVATDIYAWKLLRLDWRRSRNVTRDIITNMVTKLLEVS